MEDIHEPPCLTPPGNDALGGFYQVAAAFKKVSRPFKPHLSTNVNGMRNNSLFNSCVGIDVEKVVFSVLKLKSREKPLKTLYPQSI
jgi:hypothetical protein